MLLVRPNNATYIKITFKRLPPIDERQLKNYDQI